VTRGEGNGSYWWRAVSGRAMCQGVRRERTPAMRPRAKEAQGHGGELCARKRRMVARRDG
jgi:hypothetical protein